MQNGMTGYTTDEILAFIETQSPGFLVLVEEEKRALDEAHPDHTERRRFVLSHFVKMENIL